MTVAAEPSKGFPWVIYIILLIIIVAASLAPVASVAVAGWIANSNGCKLDEGSVHPCVIGGRDYGQLLYTLGVLGWLMLATLPGGALALMVWLIILIVHRSTWQKRRSA